MSAVLSIRAPPIWVHHPMPEQSKTTDWHAVCSHQAETLSEDFQITARVKRAGQRMAAVVARPDFDWALPVIDKDDANTFVLPGGKVARPSPKTGMYANLFPIWPLHRCQAPQ